MTENTLHIYCVEQSLGHKDLKMYLVEDELCARFIRDARSNYLSLSP